MGKLKAFIFNKEETTGILNELYADLSNEIEFEDFLKEATYSFYCMELGVIRDLQGQATAKSGASKQSSSFLKATTMTLFTISESEKASYVDQIYSYLGDDPFLKQFLPIDPATKDLFNLVKDGVLLCKLINIVVPGIIDEHAVNTKRVLNPWERNENHTLCLNSASTWWKEDQGNAPKGVPNGGAATSKEVDNSKEIALMKAKMNKLCDLLDEIIAHTKENVVKKQALTYDDMEAEREEVISYHNFSSALASNVV
ncbi:hypothetical protein DKX38_017577 [Salix brachista]|uniref:Calponin-homology (CH) domain-containing protein n=1 Tax=Salix brachista TaxID=2182728 RepID=A0A5N5KWI7_9ROSI|nr:hypothetical protein DKX38_017577 [Salix brachista]